jgi:hypothetical protein
VPLGSSSPSATRGFIAREPEISRVIPNPAFPIAESQPFEAVSCCSAVTTLTTLAPGVGAGSWRREEVLWIFAHVVKIVAAVRLLAP